MCYNPDLRDKTAQSCLKGYSPRMARDILTTANRQDRGVDRERPLTTASLVIIPTYNERENIPELLPRVLAHEWLSVLVVDDGSPDGTGDIVAAAMQDDP